MSHYIFSDAKRCFLHSRLFISDEMQHINLSSTLSFMDFIEAFVRIADERAIPDEDNLNALDCSNMKAFVELEDLNSADAAAKSCTKTIKWDVRAENISFLGERMYRLLQYAFVHLEQIAHKGENNKSTNQQTTTFTPRPPANASSARSRR